MSKRRILSLFNVTPIVLPLLVLGIAIGLAACGQGESEDQGEAVMKPAPGSSATQGTEVTDNDLFDASSSAGGSDKPGEIASGKARTLDVKKLKRHLGHLYLAPETDTAIRKLVKQIEAFAAENRHVTNEMTKEYKRLLAVVSNEQHDPFLERADSELNRHNIRFEKSDLRLKDKDGKPFERTFSGFIFKPYVFFVQNSPDQDPRQVAERIHGQLVQLKEAFDKYFGAFLDLKENPRHNTIYVMLLRRFQDYQNYNRIAEPFRDDQMTLAHYEPNNQMLVVPLEYGARRGKKSKEAAEHEGREVMFHEGTHQLLHYYSSGKRKGGHLSAFGAMWSDEGVAEYFGGHKVLENGKVAFGRINSRIEAIARDDNDRKRRLPLVKLLKWTRSEYARKKRENFALATAIHLHVYSQGWGLVYFLNNYKNGIYKKDFQTIMRRQIEKGDTGMPVFRSVFGDRVEAVEDEFNEYLDKMTDAWKSGKLKVGDAFKE